MICTRKLVLLFLLLSPSLSFLDKENNYEYGYNNDRFQDSYKDNYNSM